MIEIRHRFASNHNGGQLQFGPAASCISPPETAAEAATLKRTPRISRACSARSCGSIRGASAASATPRPATTPSPASERAPGRSSPSGCATQPVPLLIRSGPAQDRGRGRGPGSARGGQLGDAAQGPRCELRLIPAAPGTIARPSSPARAASPASARTLAGGSTSRTSPPERSTGSSRANHPALRGRLG